MIQPINTINHYNFYSQRKQSARTTFKGYYDPTSPHITSQMQVGAKDTISKIAEKAKDAVDKMKESFFNNLPADARETIVQNSGDNSILDTMLSNSMKSFNTKGGLEIVDGSNLVDNETGLHTHIMPDGTPYSYTSDVNSATPTDIISDATQNNLQMLDANNFYNPDNGVLSHIMPDGTDVNIDVSDLFDNSENATSLLGDLVDTISDIFDSLF